MIFAETAKKIIIEEGLEAVSVRRVSDQAGYTFATLYNHFGSLDGLFWYTRNIMIGDIVEYMEANVNESLKDIENVEKLFGLYMEYFIKNPNVFRFFYFHHLKREEKPEGCDTNIPGGKQTIAAFEFLTSSGHYTPEEAGILIQTLIYCTHGLLTLSISDNDNLGINEIPARMNEVIHLLLREFDIKKKERNK